MKTIGIIGAMDSEISEIVSAMRQTECLSYGQLVFTKGTLGSNCVIVVKCGVGKVNAARCAQMLIDRFEPDFIINAGVAGGIDPQLEIGDLIIAETLVQHDFDACVWGYAKGCICDRSDMQHPTAFHSDSKLGEAFKNFCAHDFPDTRILYGTVASGDQFISTKAQKQAIYDVFKADAAEMEGCAIAQVCSYCEVPFIVIRAISDLSDGSTAADFAEFEEAMAKKCSRITQELIKSL